MSSPDERHAPLPARLTPAEREFYTELRRLADASRLPPGELWGAASPEAAWESWLSGWSLPPKRAIRELASRLAGYGVDADRLAVLWARAVLPTSYPAEPSRSLVRPAQLPVATGDFMGRADELKVLEDLARRAATDGDAAAVIVIEGTAGTGKTTLATHLAHQVSHLFPDGQLWVSLRGFGDAGEPVTDGQALRGFLDAFGAAPGNQPLYADERADLYRGMLAGRRVLVVLDNARDAGQVRRLLPGSPGCLALVTTRARPAGFDGAGLHELRLGPFSDSEARDLLERRLGADRVQAERQAADELSELCGRLPLALAIAAGRAAADPGVPLAALAGELHSRSLLAGQPADPAVITRTVFTASYAQLSPGAARMFRMLGACPGPDIGVPAAASLAAVTPEQARAALAELSAAHLVAEHQPGRFAVHDLLHTYAAGLARADEGAAGPDAAVRRLLDYYLRGMHTAVTVIYPPRPAVPLVPPAAGVQAERFGGRPQALAWCRAERTAAQTLVMYAAGHGGFGAYCWQLPWAMGPLLARGGFLHDYLAVQRVALAAARSLGDPFGQGTANHEYAHACALLGEVGESGAHLEEALRWFTRSGDRAAAARTLNAMAQLLVQDGEYLRALEREKEALELRRTVGDPDEIAHSEETIGSIYHRLGRHGEAVRHCQRSIDISRETGSRALTADALATIASVHLGLADYGRAVACYMEVLVIYREIGDNAGIAEALTGLGDAQQAKGDVPAACAAWRQAAGVLSGLPNADIQPVKARLARHA
ncbi:MAG TPA: tetratricopeptide repeat protein [Trebonia sp.]